MLQSHNWSTFISDPVFATGSGPWRRPLAPIGSPRILTRIRAAAARRSIHTTRARDGPEGPNPCYWRAAHTPLPHPPLAEGRRHNATFIIVFITRRSAAASRRRTRRLEAQASAAPAAA